MKKHREHLSFANVTSMLALFVALATGGAYAAEQLGRNDVKSTHIKPNAVKNSDIAGNAVTSSEVANASLLAEDFAAGQLPAGPQGPPGAPGAPGAPGTNTSAPAGAVSFFNLAACPSGWTELTGARGRYLVGVPSGGTLGGTAGTALTNLESRLVSLHNHVVVDTGHAHGGTDFAGISDVSPGTSTTTYDMAFTDASNSTISDTTDISPTGINTQAAGTVAGTNAPYIQLLVCQKS